MGDSPDRTPEIQFTKDETNDRLVVAKTDGSVAWEDLSFRSTEAGRCDINADVAAATGQAAGADTVVAIDDTNTIAASDFIDIETTAASTDVIITIIHDDTNTVLGEYTFQSIQIVA